MNTNRSVLLKADGFLLNHYINRLPLTLEELERIARDMGWLLDTYQEAAEFIDKAGMADFVKEHKALTTIFDGQTMILYDGQLPYSEKLQYICHEMGHITLRHTTEHGIVGLCNDPKRMVMQEDEADAFAAEMMAPACVMHERGITDIEGLIKTNLISKEQAVKHAENLAHQADTDEERQLCMTMNPHDEKKSSGKKRYIAIGLSSFALACAIIAALMVQRSGGNDISSNEPIKTSQSTTTLPEPTTEPNFTTAPDTTQTSNSSEVATIESTDGSVQPEEITVYVTAKGKKYHKPDCYHIAGKNNTLELTIEEAEQAGYEPCKDCF